MLVILATTTAIIVPRFNGSFAGLSVDQATAVLLTDLRYAQARAITQRRAVQLAVADDAPSRYQLLVESDAPAEGFVPVPGRFGRARLLPTDARLVMRLPEGPERRPAAVTFYPNGQADPSWLELSAPHHDTVTVAVDEATGHVTVLTTPHE